MSLVSRRLVALGLIFVVALGLVFVATKPAPAAVTVGPDPFGPQYVVSGAVLLDSSFSGDPSRRTWAVTCAQCQWVYTDPCFGDTPNGTPQKCGLTGVHCPPGSLYFRVWFRDGPTMAWDPIGLICSKTTTPTLTRDVAALVDMQVVGVPALRPTTQPSGKAFSGLPVWFNTHQPRVIHRAVRVLEWDVNVTAAPRWRWTFGDGIALNTSDPGGVYPAGAVRHTYRGLGRVRATATSLWSAEWSVQGLPPQPVNGTLAQVRGVNLSIRPTRSILVPTVTP